jgi:TolA-binding protein
MRQLDRLASRVAEAQDREQARRHELPAVREQLLRSLDPRPAWPRAALVALVACAALGGLWWSGRREVVRLVADGSVSDGPAIRGAKRREAARSASETARDEPAGPRVSRSTPPAPGEDPSNRWNSGLLSPPLTASASPVAPALPTSPVPVVARGLRPRPQAVLPTPPEAASSEPPAPVGWQELASKGHFSESYAAAEAIGLARLCESISARELLTLSESARLSGHAAAARRPLLATRTRFPGSAEEAAATFALGRIAFDELRDDAEAAQWFATLLREHPAGSLTREATGRLIEALVRSGDHASARAHAARYLEAFPLGPHAPLARRVLGR